METIYPPAFGSAGCTTPWSTYATEVDYLRVFWNMHGASGASFGQIVDWLDLAFDSSQSNAYDELEDAANDESTPSIVNTRWDYYKWYHGVDHP